MLIGFQNETNTSVVTLQWAPPTSTSGVDVGYVLAVSPPPVSGSTITTQTSTDITVSYNIQYNVTIRTENCAGSSQDSVVVFELGISIMFYSCCFLINFAMHKLKQYHNTTNIDYCGLILFI